MTAFVLWESHAEGPIDRFGPHQFLTACVADRLHQDRFALARSEALGGRSCGGNGGVVRDLRGHAVWNAPQLIAVLDTDKLHDLLGGEARKLVAPPAYATWSTTMEAAFRTRLGAHDAARLIVCFLDRNLETLLQLLEGGPVKKDTVSRDKILGRASASAELIRRASDQMPTWAALVDAVAQTTAMPRG